MSIKSLNISFTHSSLALFIPLLDSFLLSAFSLPYTEFLSSFLPPSLSFTLIQFILCRHLSDNSRYYVLRDSKRTRNWLLCATVDCYKLWPLQESGRLAKKCVSFSHRSIFTPSWKVTCQATVLTNKCVWLNRHIRSKMNCSYQDLRRFTGQLLFMIDIAWLYTGISKNRLTTVKNTTV